MTTHSSGGRAPRSFKRTTSPGRARSSSGAFRAGGFSDRPTFSRGGGSGSRGGFSGRPRFGSSRGGTRFGGRSGKKTRGNSIDISKFIHTPDPNHKEVTIAVLHRFEDFGFSTQVNKNLAHRKFVTPSPIQDQAIPVVMKGSDIIGLANTGTGKTAAFLLPTIEKMLKNPTEKALVIAPTRELATQIDQEFRAFAFATKLYSTVCVGGMPIGKQIRELSRLNHLIIGTPGRIKDLVNRGIVKLEEFRTVVLDEVDRMLDMGFIDDMKFIVGGLPENRQTLFFSATMPPEIKKLTGQFLKNPITIDIKTGTTTKNIAQDVVRVEHGEDKLAKLEELLRRDDMYKVIIFAETKREVDRLSRDLKMKGFQVGHLHGDKRQRERDRTLADFKSHKTTILVATDVAARGIDVKDVSHVINYTIPQTYEDYTHRIGRTGRAGKIGQAYTFV
jgi:superfamily II DNA/RNA helicase